MFLINLSCSCIVELTYDRAMIFYKSVNCNDTHPEDKPAHGACIVSILPARDPLAEFELSAFAPLLGNETFH